MPAVNFKIAWPDGDKNTYYSPSTIIYEFLKGNESYPQKDFSIRVSLALEKASERVRAKYGYACSSAADEHRKIQQKLSELNRHHVDGDVRVISLST